jgi:hypothetical protein
MIRTTCLCRCLVLLLRVSATPRGSAVAGTTHAPNLPQMIARAGEFAT